MTGMRRNTADDEPAEKDESDSSFRGKLVLELEVRDLPGLVTVETPPLFDPVVVFLPLVVMQMSLPHLML